MAQPKRPRRRPAVSFERYLAKKLPTPRARAQFDAAREKVRATADLLAALDVWRKEGGLSRAEMARRMAMHDTAISRLFNDERSNPTLATLVEMLAALDLHATLTLSPREQVGRKHARVLAVRSELVPA